MIACENHWNELMEYLLNNVYLSYKEFEMIETINNDVFNEKINSIRNIGNNVKKSHVFLYKI